MEQTEVSDCLLGKIPFPQTNSFSTFFLDYIQNDARLSEFHNGMPSSENLLAQIEQRNFNDKNRLVLTNVLEEQYKGYEVADKVSQNIQLLKSGDTYTITTGHQLNIFTGPLYVIYKIVTVIRACEELKALRPDCEFVPVYWMASEDHDFEEISHFRFNQEKISWETDQKGAVGRFNPKSISSVFSKITSIPEFFKEAYLKHETLAEAVRYYMNFLFGEYGLIVVDADHHDLKKAFTPVIQDDLFKHSPEKECGETSSKLQALGYKTQVFPREINFFYLKDDLRSRIEKQGNQFKVIDSDITFTEEELRTEIKQFPERFSPNVVLRPLYQEFILPNLAYVGGPSELVYWLQLKGVFNHFDTAFPLLMPRLFAGVLNQRVLNKIEKANLTLEEIFIEDNQLVKSKVREASNFELELKEQKKRLSELFKQAENQAALVDQTLVKTVKGEHKKSEKSLEKIELKLLRAERRNQEILVNRIYDIKEALFPGGSPQERKDNFLNFYISNPNFISSCMEAADPFDYRFHLLRFDE